MEQFLMYPVYSFITLLTYMLLFKLGERYAIYKIKRKDEKMLTTTKEDVVTFDAYQTQVSVFTPEDCDELRQQSTELLSAAVVFASKVFKVKDEEALKYKELNKKLGNVLLQVAKLSNTLCYPLKTIAGENLRDLENNTKLN